MSGPAAMLARARIYIFPEPRDASRMLTVRDRLDLHGWGQRVEAAGLRLVLDRDSSVLSHDFVQVHRGSDLAWTIVRQGRVVRVWQGAWGPDLGTFPTLAEAIAATLAEEGADGSRRTAPRRAQACVLPYRPPSVHRIGKQAALAQVAPARNAPVRGD